MKIDTWYNDFEDVLRAVKKLGRIIEITEHTIIVERCDGARTTVNYYTGKSKLEYYVKEN